MKNTNIQIFGTKKCRETQKAERFFKDRGINFHFVDLNEKKLSEGELKNISNSVPIEDLIDTDSSLYDKMGLKHMIFDIFEKLLEYPLLIKTPIVRYKGKATVGIQQDKWANWLKEI